MPRGAPLPPSAMKNSMLNCGTPSKWGRFCVVYYGLAGGVEYV